MKKLRISKYNPAFTTTDGKRIYEEWTSFSEVGKLINGKVFTKEEYLIYENQYLSFIKDIFWASQIMTAQIYGIECPHKSKWKKATDMLDMQQILDFSRDCLREKCWGVVWNKKIVLDFGYDFYLHVNAADDIDVIKICTNNGLYFETWDRIETWDILCESTS